MNEGNLVILLGGFQKKGAKTPKKSTIMKNQKNKNLTSWDDHLDEKYGKTGTPTRDKYEQGFEAFKLGVLIQEARKKRHLTQEELALKVGTTKKLYLKN